MYYNTIRKIRILQFIDVYFSVPMFKRSLLVILMINLVLNLQNNFLTHNIRNDTRSDIFPQTAASHGRSPSVNHKRTRHQNYIKPAVLTLRFTSLNETTAKVN